MNDKEKQAKLQQEILDIEASMMEVGFWDNKIQAQKTIKKLGQVKDELEGVGKYDRGNATLSILSGAGGSDSEDFSRILLHMYTKYCEHNNWSISYLHQHKNDHGGYRNLSVLIEGSNVFGKLKNENGVHRLVRISPFNANKKRHTSFSMVEIVPVIPVLDEITLSPDDLKIEFTKAGGPGGQNVNKRETAVRITHVPSGITVVVSGQRTQEANRQQALQTLNGKIFHAMQKAQKKGQDDLRISKTTEIEWGNQIRSYVLHPYKMVKDHRSGLEIHDIDKVLQRGDLDQLIDSNSQKND